MIYLIGGENIFESRLALNGLVEGFAKKGMGVKKAYASDQEDFKNALASLDSFGLFAGGGRNAIVIYGFDEALKADEERMVELSNSMADKGSDQSDIVIYSRKNWDKRSKFYKHFNQLGNVKEFKLLSGRDLDKWLIDFIKEKGLRLDRNLIQQLIFRVGNDQNILASEIDKLLTLQNEGVAITPEIFENIVVDTQNVDIWDLIDVLKSNKSKAFSILDYLSKNLEYEYIISLFARQVRLLFLALSAGSREGLQSFGVHPFVATKLIYESKNFSLVKIKKLYEKMINIDINVKSGKLDKGLALDLLLVAF